MTQAEFQSQAARLVANYGKQAYSDERIKIIWRAVEGLSAAWWAKTVDEFIGYARQAPLMDQIRERVAEERERIWGVQKRQKTEWELPANPRCFECKDSGVVMTRLKENGTFYSFRCVCTAGLSDTRNYPRWGSAYMGEFEVIA